MMEDEILNTSPMQELAYFFETRTIHETSILDLQ